MKKYCLIHIAILFVVISCNRNQHQEKIYNNEFYSIMNEIIRSRLNDAGSIKIETLPVYRTYWGSITPASDTISPPPPPPPGFISFSKQLFEQQVRLKNLDSSEATFMYNSIDTTKILILDSTKVVIPVISKSKFNEIFRTNDLLLSYQKLRERYGSSCFLQVSTPVFNSGYTKAIVEISYMCGPLHGYGSAFVLEKKEGKWRVIDEWETWVS
jgi:hypothetical protein